MSRLRRFFDPDDAQFYRGPSDEMLAVDAVSELRSLTLLYERYADRLYRYFLLCTGDPVAADRLMRDLIHRLPGDLQRFGGEDRSFAGWLFVRASDVFWHEFSVSSRLYRRVSRFIPNRSNEPSDSDSGVDTRPQVAIDFAELAPALRELPPDQREVLGIHFGAELKTASAAEALRMPASLLSSNIDSAVRALATQLDVTNTRRLSEDLSGLMSRQVLSSDNRSGHFVLIHRLFVGEVEPESNEPDQKPLMEIGVLIGVVLLGLIGIWIWSLVTPGDPQDPPDEPPSIASDPAPTRPDPTSTPTAEPEPTIEPTGEPGTDLESIAAADAEGVCRAAEGKAQFDEFINRFNAGDFEGLSEMLPDSSGDEPNDRVLELIHDDVVLNDAEDALDLLQERYAAGERWDVLEAYPAEQYRNWNGAAQLEMYEAWKQENPELSLIIVTGLDWSGEGDSLEIAQGQAVVDCDTGLVVGWDMRSHGINHSDSLHVGDYLEAMEPLEVGTSRMVRALVQTDQRPDGGLLHAWEMLWWEASDSDGTALERIDVLSLDGTTMISYRKTDEGWRLDQRNWIINGLEGDPPFPNELTMTMPWLRQLPEVIKAHEIDPDTDPSTTITEDYTQIAGSPMERFFDIQIDNGYLGTVRLRERTRNGERVRPEIRILDAWRTVEFDPEHFEFHTEPGFPDESEPHYHVPTDEWTQLEVDQATENDDQLSETYRISWNEVEFGLRVQPSRSGLNADRVPAELDEAWTTATAEYRFGMVVWAHRQFSGYPTDAVWDDGRYRFTLEVDQDTVSGDRDWNLHELVQLVNALSADVVVSESGAGTSIGGYGGGSGLARGLTILQPTLNR